jgi:hypothetical protein
MTFLDDPAAYSSLVAPVIDRTAISLHNAVGKDQMTALRGEHRFHPGALALFAGMLSAGPISKAEFSELMRYQHFGSSDEFLTGLADRGAVTIADDGSFSATPAALEVSKNVVNLQAETVTKLFAPLATSLPELRGLINRCRVAAMEDPISTLSRLSGRAWLPEAASDAARIWDASVVLRMHRSDAHAKAWAEAGHSASSIRSLSPGAERAAIEVRTNELAATPWAPLSSSERLTLLAGLGALPGTGSPI